MNDRYRMEQKGHTRKSASSAKPKREAGTTTPAAKKPAKPKLFGKGPAREPVGAIPSTPEMKQMRRYWWIAMGAAIIIAVAMVPISKYKNTTLDSALFGLYAVALSAALYLEFGPLRKMRREAVEAAKAKNAKGGKSAAKAAPKPADARAAEPVAVTPGPRTFTAKVLQFFVGKPKPPESGGSVEVPPAGKGDSAPSEGDEKE